MTDGSQTLEEFFQEAAQAQQSRRDRGVVQVHFQHQVLEPGATREIWDDVPLADVPAVEAIVDVPGGGYMGSDARWRVMHQQWLPGAAVILHVRDAHVENG